MKSHALFAALLLGMTGCSVMGKPPEPAQLYVLPAPSFQALPGVASRPVTVKIALPEVASGLDTARIAVMENGYKLNYFAQANWPEPLPDMLQTRLVDGFEKSGLVRGVSSDSSGVQSDYILQLDVQEFNALQASDLKALPRVRVRYRALLLATDSHSLVASVPAEQDVTATANSMEAIVAAFNVADEAAMRTLLPTLASAIPLKQKGRN